jgi:hypothetical protein
MLNKGRYQGEVKLELTFYSAVRPAKFWVAKELTPLHLQDPQPPKKPRPVSANYSGPGTFEPALPITSAPSTPQGRRQAKTSDPASSVKIAPFNRPDLYSIPAHLRPGHSAGTSVSSSSSRLSIDGSTSALRTSSSYSNLAEASRRTPSAEPIEGSTSRLRRASFNQLSSSQNDPLNDANRRDSFPVRLPFIKHDLGMTGSTAARAHGSATESTSSAASSKVLIIPR